MYVIVIVPWILDLLFVTIYPLNEENSFDIV